MPAGFDCSSEKRVGFADRLIVELGLSVHVGIQRADPRPAELHEPAQIRRRNKVPGWSKNVRAENGAIGISAIKRGVPHDTAPLRNRPLGLAEFLGLHGDQPAYDTIRRLDGRSPEMLVV